MIQPRRHNVLDLSIFIKKISKNTCMGGDLGGDLGVYTVDLFVLT